MFVLIVVETVENDENHAGETEDSSRGHQEEDQLPVHHSPFLRI